MNLINTALAQAPGTYTGGGGGGKYDTLGHILTSFTEDVLQSVIVLILALGVIVFMWGVLKYVTAGGDESKASEGRNLMIYGIIALFVMVSVWGLVNILTQTFNLNNTAPPIPKLSK